CRLSLSRAGRAGNEPARPRRADGSAGRVAEHCALADGLPVRRGDLPTAFHAEAPVRLDFAGGWTDVPPFSAREGGIVVNAAIALPARADVELGGPRMRLVAEDLGQELECASAGGLVLDGRLDLLKAALRMFPVQAACTLTTRSAAPPGSGLGSSGALDVALVAALLSDNWKHQQALDREMCTPEMARLENVVRAAGTVGGKAAGAGAGGSMFFVTTDDSGQASAAAREAGATVLPVRWAPHGVR